jgi:hypothetical protein
MPSKFVRQTADGCWTPLNAKDFDDAAEKMIAIAKREGRAVLWGSPDPSDETGVVRRVSTYRAFATGDVGPADLEREKAAAETARRQGRQQLAVRLLQGAG